LVKSDPGLMPEMYLFVLDARVMSSYCLVSDIYQCGYRSSVCDL
jgi:hypothetical protein